MIYFVFWQDIAARR